MIKGITEDILRRVYDFSEMTNEELRCKFFQKLEECIEVCNSVSDIMDWVKNEGLPKEINVILNAWLEDGTLENLININKIDELRTELMAQVESVNQSVNTNINQLNSDMDAFKNELNTEMDTFKNELNTEMDTLKNEVNTNITESINNLDAKINGEANKITKLENKNNTNSLISTDADGYSNNTSTFVFAVKEAKNMQSIAYGNNTMFVGFSLDDATNGIIIKYNMSGVEIGRSANLPIEHSSSMVFNKINGKLYVANGGGTAGAKVFIINPSSLTIEQTFDYSSLGASALITLDKDNNLILHVGQSDAGAKTIYRINQSNNAQAMFTINNLGTPQGLAVYRNSIFYQTNLALYEFDYEGNMLNTIYLYTDNSEPQGLTVGEINGTEVLMYGKNRYLSDTDVNTIYAITNLEAHKKTSLRVVGSFSPKGNSSLFLSPVMINFSVRKINGTWTNMNWDNMVATSDNIVKEVTAGMNSQLGYYEVGIKLYAKLHSYAQCIVTPEQGLFLGGYDVHGQLGSDGQSLNIRFKKSHETAIIDPSTLDDGSGIIVTLIGGMKI